MRRHVLRAGRVLQARRPLTGPRGATGFGSKLPLQRENRGSQLPVLMIPRRPTDAVRLPTGLNPVDRGKPGSTLHVLREPRAWLWARRITPRIARRVWRAATDAAGGAG